ncbi:AmpG family muropeptide MFS transporter [Vibrio cincinnatiensis]|jgi:PAT family beta-lactamase induction signal transducer AmpG|uniref:MFS transporter, PAT family, beta-lactamase induction signal transducer AmpG n=1 Tax=Vibrio cincinnatiensis DSM 19608 TaxID=1123491 RepID=A0A1T4SIK2_VIBCI|nr:MFS transporter [Vibrio cincinnatiensis]MCG3724003.1 MFS transporter [Vibrio cincinnatiensis]MCG3727499.1 MFS transporter [Vibrio cincinnatiensis]MCG3734513.1 MFS transporter [Vibrio cincinnatiensis]MCG3738678.1 MFS transporter [Vibrio cincinnatiensis]MCG3745249.1 MFS transporter [Vibrio cincinnatiensis]
MPSNAQSLTWSETFKSYLDRRLLWIFMMGCSSGFPWVLIGSNMSGWLKDAGLTLAAIGYFGSVFSVYAINFLWAPLVDRVKLPFLHTWLGQRRSWILFCQFFVFICTLLIAGINPANNLFAMSILALGIAIASATQDIAIDAFRIDSFQKSDQSKLPQASAMAVIGWWTGYSLPGYFAFINADAIGWNMVYYGMAAVLVLLMLFTLFVGEPQTYREMLQKQAEERHNQVVHFKVISWLSVTLLEPFIDFFRRNGSRVAITLLLFVFLFKIGEAFLGRMSIAFYKDIGFSNEQIGYYSKLIGWGVTMLFTFVGSMFNVRFGIVRGLMIGGIAMSASNLMFAWIAQVGPNEHLLLATIFVDNFTTAFSTVAFVSFLTVMTGQAFSATQYALLASLGNFSRTTLASFSGELAEYLNNWSLFFILTALMVIPSLCMLYSLRHYFNNMLSNARKNQQASSDQRSNS